MVLEKIARLVKMKRREKNREKKKEQRSKRISSPALEFRNKSAKKRTRFQLRTPANEANGGHKREEERKREKERKMHEKEREKEEERRQRGGNSFPQISGQLIDKQIDRQLVIYVGSQTDEYVGKQSDKKNKKKKKEKVEKE